jgi:hypothetical protein
MLIVNAAQVISCFAAAKVRLFFELAKFFA